MHSQEATMGCGVAVKQYPANLKGDRNLKMIMQDSVGTQGCIEMQVPQKQ